MAVITGFFKDGCPLVRVHIGGASPDAHSVQFAAIVDTGFSGFVAMPLIQAFPLGLVLYGTSRFSLADGSVQDKLLGSGFATIGGETRSGIIALDETSNEVLLGMDFLRKFDLVMLLTDGAFLLVPQKEFKTGIGSAVPPAKP